MVLSSFKEKKSLILPKFCIYLLNKPKKKKKISRDIDESKLNKSINFKIGFLSSSFILSFK